ncbi:MAG: DUF1697 domain-containing protein [Acidimicrobiia bacterium]
MDSNIALLRGINVGGKNRVEMPRLKAIFEALGYNPVATYINSGNVIFGGTTDAEQPVTEIEQAIEDEFGLSVRVLLRTKHQVDAVLSAVPRTWVHDKTTRSEVLFLWDEVDRPDIVDEIPVREGIDRVLYAPGAVLWNVDRSDLGRSRMSRLVGSKIYKMMTMRNINTTRKLAGLMHQLTE